MWSLEWRLLPYSCDIIHLLHPNQILSWMTQQSQIAKVKFRNLCIVTVYLFWLNICAFLVQILLIELLWHINGCWSSFYKLSLHSIHYFLLLCIKFLVWYSPTCLCLLLWPLFWCHIWEIIAKTSAMKIFLYPLG